GGEKTILDGKMNLDTGVILNNTSGVEIKSLIIKNYKSDGVDILGSGNSNSIFKTHFLNINYYGVMLDSSTSSDRIVGCSISGAYYGVYDSGSYLVMKDCETSYCFRGFYSTADSNNANITHCIINYNNGGIYVNGIGTHIIKNNILGAVDTGIYARSSCFIEENVIKDTIYNDGIYLSAANSIIKGNHVCSNGQNGIYVTSRNNSVIDNEVNDNAGIGILIVSYGCIITGNSACGNGRYDIARVMANNIIQDNICNKCLPPWICGSGTSEGQEDMDINKACCFADIKVPEDYPTIQAAVDAAVSGDIIFVESGIYNEQISIKKDFIKIIGEKKTVLNGEMRLDTGFILSDTVGTEIKSFIIKNFRIDGIDILGNSKSNVIEDTQILDINYYGISVDTSSENNQIADCIIEGNYVGTVDRSNGLRIDKSSISYNGYFGVYNTGNNMRISQSTVQGSLINTGIECIGSGIQISGCKVFQNGYCGININDSCTVKENEISENAYHGLVLISSNTAKNNRICANKGYGMFAYENNSVIGNIVKGNEYTGIIFSNDNIVEGNTAQENKPYDMVRIVSNNTIRNNTCGKCLPPWICGEQSESMKDKEIPQDSDCENILATIHVPADYPTIQTAVDAAFSGDIILVENGIYHEQVTINKGFIKIIGKNKTVLDGEMKLDSGFTLDNADGVEIRSFIIENFALYGINILASSGDTISKTRIFDNYNNIYLEDTATNCVIADSIVMGGGMAGITNLGNNLRIERCQISYNGSTGVYLRDCNFYVGQSDISNNFGNGINFDISDYSACIIGNKLYENRNPALIANGNCLIKGNEICNTFSSGVGALTNNCIVEENLICSNKQDGIIMRNGSSAIRNKVHDNGRYGIAVEQGNFVEGNTVLGNKYYDINRTWANSIIKNNICVKSSPPWLCKECCPSPETDLKNKDLIKEEQYEN
ncbi:MAG: right-handed parallel beta-helix repeat-containing protein, partial [Clostridia bacterium]|nr:right-handed parallel beta-helix repeat-containing protein [Clostridia bacterium]